MSEFIYAVREYIEYEGLLEEAFFKDCEDVELRIKKYLLRNYYRDETDFDELVRQSKVPMLNPTPAHKMIGRDLGLSKLASGDVIDIEPEKMRGDWLWVEKIDLH